jgi:prepilin-type processing-associated H-X9-DG protein
MAGTYSQASMRETFVPHPTDTAMFGEKKNLPHEAPPEASDYFMDLKEGLMGNDMDRVEQSCHSVLRTIKGANSGGSNYAFVDGSARFMRYGTTVSPLNMWAVGDDARVSYSWNPY